MIKENYSVLDQSSINTIIFPANVVHRSVPACTTYVLVPPLSYAPTATTRAALLN